MFTSASADEANAAIAGWVERSETHHRCVGKDDDGYRFAPSILRTISTRHCEPTGRAKRARWLAMTLMGHSILNARTRRHIERTTVTSLADRERVSRYTSPYCRRNSNLLAPMRGRASVQFLPAYASYG